MSGTATGVLSICRDETCPKCGWFETYSEVDAEAWVLLAIGCRKCGWRKSTLPTVTRKAWDSTHDDYKLVKDDGSCWMLRLSEDGATVLVRVEVER